MNARQKPIAQLTEREKSDLIYDRDGIEKHDRLGCIGDTIGERIDEMRKARRWSQYVLADKVGLDVRQVRRHIKNQATPTLLTLKAYEDVFRETVPKS